MKKLFLTLTLVSMAPSLVAYPWQRKVDQQQELQQLKPQSWTTSAGVFFGTLAVMGAAYGAYCWYTQAKITPGPKGPPSIRLYPPSSGDDSGSDDGGSMRRILTQDAEALPYLSDDSGSDESGTLCRVLTKDGDALRGDLAGALARVNRATWERNIDEGQVGRQRLRPVTGLGTFGRRFKLAEVIKVWNSDLANLAIKWGMIPGPQAPAMSPAVHAALLEAMDKHPKIFAALLNASTQHLPSVSDVDDLDDIF